ncbi:MAG: hypothetical protein HY289_16845 [Planctomycetes bacterium]|nr:hypothetical protein [Planctomycetota bacterium]
MAWRKWMVRGIVYGIFGVAAAAALAYQRWTNPGAVREQVIAEIGRTFPGAVVSVDSARLRILGGIQLNGLRLTRANDPEKLEFLHVPSAIFYHDKEKILDGELTLRKIELVKPRLRIRRERDGSWNLQNLLRDSKGEAQTHLPAIVIHQGTLIFEDRTDQAMASVFEVNDVNLTLINDPLPRVVIRGAANSDLVGKLQVHGSIDRNSGESYLAFRATQIPLTQALLSRLPLQCPNDLFVGMQLSATASVDGKVSYHPNLPKPVYYDVHCEVKEGKLQHPRLPLPLDDLHVKLHASNGTLLLETMKARSGKTAIEAHGAAQLPCPNAEFEIDLALRHVLLGDDFAARLPTKIRELHEMFQPNGPTTIRIACAKHDGEWVALSTGAPSHVSLRPENISLMFKDFPYPLERTTGRVDYNLMNERVDVKLEAHAGERPVILAGHWTGEGDQADVDFSVQAEDVPIDDKLLKALRTDDLRSMHDFAKSFHATGKLNARTNLSKRPGQPFRNVYHLYFHETKICWDNFPYPLENVSGHLNIFPDHWSFSDFRGSRNGGTVMLQGKSIPRDDRGFEHGIALEITGDNVLFDDELGDAVRPMKEMHKTWQTFNPTGRVTFKAIVNRPSPDIKDLEVSVAARGCNAKPTFFTYRIQDVQGDFRFHKMRLDINKLRARHDQTMIALDSAAIDLDSLGGYYARLNDLQVQGLQFDEELTNALPKKLQEAAKTLKLDDPLRIKTQVVIAQPHETGKPPDIYWDGQMWMFESKFTAGLDFKNVTGTVACIGRVNGKEIVGIDGNLVLERATLYDQPFKDVHAKFQMRDTSPELLLIGLRAPIFGGDITGQVRVDLNTGLRYEMNLTASQINAAEAGRFNLGPKSQLSGIASARLFLRGYGSGIDTLEGNGSIDIPRGHLYNLPFLLDLLKFLGLHWPDRTAFEEFHTTFAIQGARVNVQRLDLLGSAISLSGKGDLDLITKDVKLDVYPMWGRIEQILPPAVRPYPTTLSKNLLTVEVRGKLTSEPKDLKFQLKPMPVIIDPLLLLRDRMMGQGNERPEISTPERRRGFRIWE